MTEESKIFIAGHRGMVGSAVERVFRAKGHRRLLLASRGELDLREQSAVRAFFQAHRPEYVILAAARVGGIKANLQNPAEFLYENLQIQNNIIHSAREAGVRRLLFLGSSCIYPRDCVQPMREESLLTGPLEPTNEGYALAKIAGLKLLEAYRRQHGFDSLSLMPCNLYGPNDSFDLEKSHVLSALVKRFVDAAQAGLPAVTLWGTGAARREFMHVDDTAAAVHHFLARPGPDGAGFVNIGWGREITIRELAETVAKAAGFQGGIEWDHSKPDGMPRKCLDVSRMTAAGFVPRITLKQGIAEMISLYRAQRAA